MLIFIFFSCQRNKSSVDEKKELKSNVNSIERVYFKWPQNNSVVSSPVYIDMGIEGIKVEVAGKVNKGFGHHHILINQFFWPKGKIIPMSDTTIHYGKGQTDASVELPPGKYILSLQFADGVHSSFGKELASSIKIKVE